MTAVAVVAASILSERPQCPLSGATQCSQMRKMGRVAATQTGDLKGSYLGGSD